MTDFARLPKLKRDEEPAVVVVVDEPKREGAGFEGGEAVVVRGRKENCAGFETAGEAEKVGVPETADPDPEDS